MDDDHKLWDSEFFWETFTWQNNLIRVSIAISVAASIAVLVYFIFIFSSSQVEDAGSVAIPLTLISMTLVLVLICGLLLEREKIKHRLPQCTVVRVGLAAFGSIFIFGLKSFSFLFCMYASILFGIFLLRKFDDRLRAAAVCGFFICLVVAEAIRRAGGYDSGGVSRVLEMVYAFFIFFSPGFVVLTTLRHLPRIMKACFGLYVIMTLLFIGTLLSSVSRAMNNEIAGSGNKLDSEYCIKDDWQSPLQALVAAFQDSLQEDIRPRVNSTDNDTFVIGPFNWVPLTTYVSTTTVTTSDPCIYVEVPVFPDVNETDEYNETNRTRIERICPMMLEVNIVDFDPNSTTTTSTSTTTSSTTRTTSTSTTTTTTSTSTTTTTTTTTTSTTSTSTTTTTTSTSTTNNNTKNATANVTTTTIISPFEKEVCWLSLPGMYLNGYTLYGQGCHDLESALSLCTRVLGCNGITRSTGICGGTNYTLRSGKRGRSAAGFDETTLESHLIDPSCSASTTPPSCAPGTNATRVTNSGLWALIIFTLGGLWISSLAHVLYKVRSEFRVARASMRASRRVHPQHLDAEEVGRSPSGFTPAPSAWTPAITVASKARWNSTLLALADGSPHPHPAGPAQSVKTPESPKQLALTDVPSSPKQLALTDIPSRGQPRSSSVSKWTLASSIGQPRRCRNCRRCCRRCCRVVCESTGIIIVLAAYCVAAAGLVVLGMTQLKWDTTECAAERDSFTDFKAWAEAPLDRIELVWCDVGAWAGAGIGFLGFYNYAFVCAMLLNKIIKYDQEVIAAAEAEREKALHRLEFERKRTAMARQNAPTTPDNEVTQVQEKVEHQHHFHSSDHIPKEERPVAVYEDWDGRLFDI